MDQSLIDEVRAAREAALDAERPEAVSAQHAAGHLTARERIAALCDSGSFVEYGVQTQSHINRSDGPADGVVCGVARLDGQPVVVCSYDFTVANGTQSNINLGKVERLMMLSVTHGWPFVCFADGEGHRPDESQAHAGLWAGGQTPIGVFDGLAELSGWAPAVAILSGTALDGHAGILMCSECAFATAGSVVGLGETRLPVEEHERMGDIDHVFPHELAAIEATRKYLSYLLYDEPSGVPSPDAANIRGIVPDNRKRAYNMRRVIDALADEDSVFELRPNWGTSMITALARMDGRAVGIFGNQPMSRLAGAIDPDAADKMARFIELCDAYHLPLISLIDSPGFHIGPEAERAGIARHHVRTLSAVENRSVPLYCLQIRKSYGLGPLVMRGSGGNLPPELRLAWPTVETGGMSLEGAAYLVKRNEIQAAATPEEARKIRDDYANTLREKNSGIEAGRSFSFDEVIDPAETRDRIIAMLKMTPRPPKTARSKYIDPI